MSASTFCAKRETSKIGFDINASTRVTLGGDVMLHAWLRHEFEDGLGYGAFSLIAQARQFSGFVVLIGPIVTANTLVAEHAFIVQNKDEVMDLIRSSATIIFVCLLDRNPA
jgi:hypothetical protein